MVRQREDAEDLVQITAEKALRSANGPNDALEYRKWLFKVLRNAFIDKYRKSRSSENVGYGDDFEKIAAPENSLSDVLTVRYALDNINADYKEIIYLVDIAGFSYSEASEIVDVPIGTIMSRLSRARQALLTVLSKKERNIISIYKSKKYHG